MNTSPTMPVHRAATPSLSQNKIRPSTPKNDLASRTPLRNIEPAQTTHLRSTPSRHPHPYASARRPAFPRSSRANPEAELINDYAPNPTSNLVPAPAPAPILAVFDTYAERLQADLQALRGGCVRMVAEKERENVRLRVERVRWAREVEAYVRRVEELRKREEGLIEKEEAVTRQAQELEDQLKMREERFKLREQDLQKSSELLQKRAEDLKIQEHELLQRSADLQSRSSSFVLLTAATKKKEIHCAELSLKVQRKSEALQAKHERKWADLQAEHECTAAALQSDHKCKAQALHVELERKATDLQAEHEDKSTALQAELERVRAREAHVAQLLEREYAGAKRVWEVLREQAGKQREKEREIALEALEGRILEMDKARVVSEPPTQSLTPDAHHSPVRHAVQLYPLSNTTSTPSTSSPSHTALSPALPASSSPEIYAASRSPSPSPNGLKRARDECEPRPPSTPPPPLPLSLPPVLPSDLTCALPKRKSTRTRVSRWSSRWPGSSASSECSMASSSSSSASMSTSSSTSTAYSSSSTLLSSPTNVDSEEDWFLVGEPGHGDKHFDEEARGGKDVEYNISSRSPSPELMYPPSPLESLILIPNFKCDPGSAASPQSHPESMQPSSPHTPLPRRAASAPSSPPAFALGLDIPLHERVRPKSADMSSWAGMKSESEPENSQKRRRLSWQDKHSTPELDAMETLSRASSALGTPGSGFTRTMPLPAEEIPKLLSPFQLKPSGRKVRPGASPLSTPALMPAPTSAPEIASAPAPAPAPAPTLTSVASAAPVEAALHTTHASVGPHSSNTVVDLMYFSSEDKRHLFCRACAVIRASSTHPKLKLQTYTRDTSCDVLRMHYFAAHPEAYAEVARLHPDYVSAVRQRFKDDVGRVTVGV